MATVIVNNDSKVEVANGNENMRLRNSMSIDNLLVAFPDKLPDDFMLKFHNDLRYQRNRTEWSDKCYCGLVPFYNGAEHIEFAMLQWDLLVEDIATVNANGEFAGFVTPNDELHTYARSTASADITIEAWMQGIAKHFNDNAKVLILIVVDKGLVPLKEGFPLGFPSFCLNPYCSGQRSSTS